MGKDGFLKNSFLINKKEMFCEKLGREKYTLLYLSGPNLKKVKYDEAYIKNGAKKIDVSHFMEMKDLKNLLLGFSSLYFLCQHVEFTKELNICMVNHLFFEIDKEKILQVSAIDEACIFYVKIITNDEYKKMLTMIDEKKITSKIFLKYKDVTFSDMSKEQKEGWSFGDITNENSEIDGINMDDWEIVAYRKKESGCGIIFGPRN